MYTLVYARYLGITGFQDLKDKEKLVHNSNENDYIQQCFVERFFSMGQFCEKSYSDTTYRDGGSGGDRRTHKYSPPQIFRPSANLDIYIVEKKIPQSINCFVENKLLRAKRLKLKTYHFALKLWLQKTHILLWLVN